MEMQNASPEYEGQIRVSPCSLGFGAPVVDIAYAFHDKKLEWATIPPQTALYSQCLAEHERQRKLHRKLLKRGRHLLRKGSAVLAADVVNGLMRCDDLASFYPRLRSFAAEFGSLGLSEAYWNVIDAMGYFIDATTPYWRYLSVDDRRRLITWSEQMAYGRA